MTTTNTPTLYTKRLLLRQFAPTDMEALFAIYNDPDVNIFLPWFPLKSLEETKLFYENNYKNSYQQPCGYRYAICLKTNNIPIGYVHVSLKDNHDLGYGLLKEYWHKGIVTEACQAVIEKLKNDDFQYITATHDVKNPRSGSVMKQLGMQYQYSYEEQWQPKNILVTFRMYQLNLDGQNNRIYKEYWDKSLIHYVETNL